MLNPDLLSSLRAFTPFQRYDPCLRALMFMAALAPLALRRDMVSPAWDDAWFLERAVCVNRAFYGSSPREVWRCLGDMFKSPLMALLLLPAGPPGSDVAFLGVAPFILACACLTAAAGLGWMSWRLGSPFAGAALAAAALASCAPLRNAGAPLLVDGFFAIFVALLLCLPALEARAPAIASGAALRRGLLWGALFGWGLLLKATFLFCAALTAPILLFFSLQFSGLRATRQKLLAAIGLGLPPALVFACLSRATLENALSSSFGAGADFYGPERNFFSALADLVASTGWAYWLFCALLLVFAALRSAPRGLALVASGCVPALAYLILVAFSRNEQARFLWGVWTVIPIAFTLGAAATVAPRRAPPTCLWIAPIIGLAAAPMFSRFDWEPLRQAAEILRALNTGAATQVEIADDPPNLNINTFQLARQVYWRELKAIEIGTVVYQQAEGKSLAISIEQLRKADYVLFLQSDLENRGPDFTNGRRKDFLDFARACGKRVDLAKGSNAAQIFAMPDRAASGECQFP